MTESARFQINNLQDLNWACQKKDLFFCCFNNTYKILPATFDAWMRILMTVENSVLFLYAENPWVQMNLKKEALARGIDGERLIFASSIPADEYLSRYRVCDLFLDTFPYNAGTTSSDALWAGLPVLTRMGQSFASRMAASLLNALELPELIATSELEYEGLAIDLALNADKLHTIQEKLLANRSTGLLFDTPRFVKSIESAYVRIQERCRAQLPPDHIYIE
jgi:predicted O-linked N-acetylglucosamine transferase (SPINDLY family)